MASETAVSCHITTLRHKTEDINLVMLFRQESKCMSFISDNRDALCFL